MITLIWYIGEAISLSNDIYIFSKRPSIVKKKYTINIDALYPIERRQSSEFTKYYEKIWRDLDVSI